MISVTMGVLEGWLVTLKTLSMKNLKIKALDVFEVELPKRQTWEQMKAMTNLAWFLDDHM